MFSLSLSGFTLASKNNLLNKHSFYFFLIFICSIPKTDFFCRTYDPDYLSHLIGDSISCLLPVEVCCLFVVFFTQAHLFLDLVQFTTKKCIFLITKVCVCVCVCLCVIEGRERESEREREIEIEREGEKGKDRDKKITNTSNSNLLYIQIIRSEIFQLLGLVWREFGHLSRAGLVAESAVSC